MSTDKVVQTSVEALDTLALDLSNEACTLRCVHVVLCDLADRMQVGDAITSNYQQSIEAARNVLGRSVETIEQYSRDRICDLARAVPQAGEP